MSLSRDCGLPAVQARKARSARGLTPGRTTSPSPLVRANLPRTRSLSSAGDRAAIWRPEADADIPQSTPLPGARPLQPTDDAAARPSIHAAAAGPGPGRGRTGPSLPLPTAPAGGTPMKRLLLAVMAMTLVLASSRAEAADKPGRRFISEAALHRLSDLVYEEILRQAQSK